MSERALFCILLGLFVLFLLLWFIRRFSVNPRRNELVKQDLVPNDEYRSETLYSGTYGIIGKPDELRQIGGVWIPVEHKSTIYKGRIYPSHKLQLAVYCLLIEDQKGKRPPYGIIEYKNYSEQIEYTNELRSSLLTQIKKIREENPEENSGKRKEVQEKRKMGRW